MGNIVRVTLANEPEEQVKPWDWLNFWKACFLLIMDLGIFEVDP